MAILAKAQSISSHWYTSGGGAAHRQPKASGDGERATTIRDAKRLSLLPSVTNVLGVLSKGGLINWQLQQVGLAAFEKRPAEGETPDYYAKRVVSVSKETNEAAQKAGSSIHSAIESHFKGDEVEEDMRPYVLPIEAWKAEKELSFIEHESILVNTKRGYAGMCDVVGLGAGGQMFIIDWKSRTKIGKKVVSYETEVLQIAAYAATRWGEEAVTERKVYGANVYLCRTEVGRMEVKVWTPNEIFEAYQTFLSIHQIWRYLKGYDPRA